MALHLYSPARHAHLTTVPLSLGHFTWCGSAVLVGQGRATTRSLWLANILLGSFVPGHYMTGG